MGSAGIFLSYTVVKACTISSAASFNFINRYRFLVFSSIIFE
jgi:hypothetical protein